MRKIFPLFAILAVVFAIGCSTVISLIPIAVPAATYAILNNNPSAVSYVTEVSTALSAFSSQTGTALSPENLQIALSSIPVPGLAPEIVSAIYGVVTAAYSPIYEKFIAGSLNLEQVRSVLASISSGLKSGVAQYQRDHPDTSPALARSQYISMSTGDLKALANAMAKDLSQVK